MEGLQLSKLASKLILDSVCPLYKWVGIIQRVTEIALLPAWSYLEIASLLATH